MKAVVTTECTCEVYDEVTDKSTPSDVRKIPLSCKASKATGFITPA
jgi:hypothetical protein